MKSSEAVSDTNYIIAISEQSQAEHQITHQIQIAPFDHTEFSETKSFVYYITDTLRFREQTTAIRKSSHRNFPIHDPSLMCFSNLYPVCV